MRAAKALGYSLKSIRDKTSKARTLQDGTVQVLRWAESEPDQIFDRGSYHHPKFAKRALLGTNPNSYLKLAERLGIKTHGTRGSSVRRLTNRNPAHLSEEGSRRPQKWWSTNSEYYDLKDRCGWQPHNHLDNRARSTSSPPMKCVQTDADTSERTATTPKCDQTQEAQPERTTMGSSEEDDVWTCRARQQQRGESPLFFSAVGRLDSDIADNVMLDDDRNGSDVSSDWEGWVDRAHAVVETVSAAVGQSVKVSKVKRQSLTSQPKQSPDVVARATEHSSSAALFSVSTGRTRDWIAGMIA
eukprot:SAG31_NODE_18_length_35375_cov_22.525315_14_plen_300_part_00